MQKHEPARMRITEETHLSIENTKNEAVTIEVVRDFLGDVNAPGAKVEKLPRHYGDLNANVHVAWTISLAPGEQKRLTATSTFIR